MKWIQTHICINEQRWEGTQLQAFIPCFFTGFKTNFPLLLQLPLTCVISYSVQTLCDPLDCSLLCPWDFPGKNTGVACHFLIQPASPLSPALVGGFFTTEPPGKKASEPLLLLLKFWSEQNKPSERSLVCTSELSLVESYKVGAIINPLNRLGMEGKMATHSKILGPGKSHGQRSPVGYIQSTGSQGGRHGWVTEDTRADWKAASSSIFLPNNNRITLLCSWGRDSPPPLLYSRHFIIIQQC